MGIVQVTKYECKVCGERYDTKEDMKECESKPITHDLGVKVGDIVIILRGDGQGEKAKVKSIWIANKYWGHYAWKRYWHTPVLDADIISSWGTRSLTWEDYKPDDSHVTGLKRKRR